MNDRVPLRRRYLEYDSVSEGALHERRAYLLRTFYIFQQAYFVPHKVHPNKASHNVEEKRETEDVCAVSTPVQCYKQRQARSRCDKVSVTIVK